MEYRQQGPERWGDFFSGHSVVGDTRPLAKVTAARESAHRVHVKTLAKMRTEGWTDPIFGSTLSPFNEPTTAGDDI